MLMAGRPARGAEDPASRRAVRALSRAGVGCVAHHQTAQRCTGRQGRRGFVRNRGAYLVGRLVLKGNEYRPFVIALLNGPDGVTAEALLHTTPHVHNLFSSTEAPFQVTNRHYHELSDFLHSIMPSRPLGLHYSTIGFHHVSKVAVMNELRRQLGRHREVLDTAPGSPGTVAIAFTSPRSAYILKVIRDRPTAGYKWD